MRWRRPPRDEAPIEAEVEEIRRRAAAGELSYACCFCGEAIERSDVDPCAVILVARWSNDEVSQQFFAHLDCFRTAGAHTDELYFLDPEYE